MTDAERYNRYATQILNSYKSQCNVFKILKANKQGILLEQLYTKQQKLINMQQLISIMNVNSNAPVVITNPSLLTFSNAKDKSAFEYDNALNTYHIKAEFSAKDTENNVQDLDITCTVVNDKATMKTLHLQNLVQNVSSSKQNFVYITNLEMLRPYIVAYLGIVDKKNASLNIFYQLVELFEADYQKTNQGFKFIPNSKMFETNITLWYIIFSKGVKIKGKHNNTVFEKEYNLSYLPTFSNSMLNKTIIKIYYDICTTLGLTPFANVCSKNYICKAFTEKPAYICTINDYTSKENNKLPVGSCSFLIRSMTDIKWEIKGKLAFSLKYVARKEVLDMSFEQFIRNPEKRIVEFKLKYAFSSDKFPRPYIKEEVLSYPQLPTSELHRVINSLYYEVGNAELSIDNYIESVKKVLPVVVLNQWKYDYVGTNNKGNVVYRNEDYKEFGFVVEVEFSKATKSYALKSYRKTGNKKPEIKTEIFKLAQAKGQSIYTTYECHLKPLVNVLSNFNWYLNH